MDAAPRAPRPAPRAPRVRAGAGAPDRVVARARLGKDKSFRRSPDEEAAVATFEARARHPPPLRVRAMGHGAHGSAWRHGGPRRARGARRALSAGARRRRAIGWGTPTAPTCSAWRRCTVRLSSAAGLNHLNPLNPLNPRTSSPGADPRPPSRRANRGARARVGTGGRPRDRAAAAALMRAAAAAGVREAMYALAVLLLGDVPAGTEAVRAFCQGPAGLLRGRGAGRWRAQPCRVSAAGTHAGWRCGRRRGIRLRARRRRRRPGRRWGGCAVRRSRDTHPRATPSDFATCADEGASLLRPAVLKPFPRQPAAPLPSAGRAGALPPRVRAPLCRREVVAAVGGRA
jgi:hypothetical protein